MASAWGGHPSAEVFEVVGRACGVPDLAARADDPSACAGTALAQPAVFAASVAAWRALRDEGLQADVVAGHSLGEVTAATAAGVLGLRDAAELVGERGRAFPAAWRRSDPGTMAGVLGLDREAVDDAVANVPGAVVANDNAPGQVVVAGPHAAVEAAAEACRQAGGKIRSLDVEGAFHTAAMSPAVVRVRSTLDRLHLDDPEIPIVSGVSCDIMTAAAEVRRSLVDGVLATVRWRGVQERLSELGIRTVIEAGPGGVLRGLTRRGMQDVAVHAVDGPEAARQVVTALRSGEKVGAR
jgi:[acyl-carrier-protein] S-malonyltransferase